MSFSFSPPGVRRRHFSSTGKSPGLQGIKIVCARRSVNRNDKQRQEVRSKLVSQEYTILARRHLRDLRQDAYVEYR